MTDPRFALDADGGFRVLAPAPLRERVSWALYDFANTIFSMNIVTLYFAVWIVAERGASNMAYSIATSLSSAAVLVAAPWIGARLRRLEAPQALGRRPDPRMRGGDPGARGAGAGVRAPVRSFWPLSPWPTSPTSSPCRPTTPC